jgi:hypothetical protein
MDKEEEEKEEEDNDEEVPRIRGLMKELIVTALAKKYSAIVEKKVLYPISHVSTAES